MNRTRRGGIAAIAVGLALALTACGGVGSTTAASSPTGGTSPVPELSPNQQVSITFESYNLSTPGPWTDTFNQLISQFEAKYPNIHVTAQKPSGATSNGVNNNVSSVQAEEAAGNPPDVAQQTFGDMDFVVNNLKAQSLDTLFGTSAVQANFGGAHPFAPAATTLGNYNGQTYGIPFVFSTPVLYYNANLFQQAGLDPNSPPTTWDQVKTDALAIKAKTGKDGAYLDCLTVGAGDWCYQALVDSAGGSVISPDSSKLTYDQAPAVQAVSMAQDLVKSGATPNLTQVPAVNEFTAGNMGMILESSAEQGVFQKGSAGKWTLNDAAMPAFAGHPVVPTNSGAALFVFSKDPAKQRAAWDLIQFLTSDQAYNLISSKIGYLPVRTGLVDDPADLKSWADQNPLIQPNLTQLTNIKPWVAFPGTNYVQVRNGMLQAVQNAVYQGADPQSTLTAAANAGDQLLPSSPATP